MLKEKLYCSGNLDIDYKKDTRQLIFSWFEGNHFQEEQYIDADALMDSLLRVTDRESEDRRCRIFKFNEDIEDIELVTKPAVAYANAHPQAFVAVVPESVSMEIWDKKMLKNYVDRLNELLNNWEEIEQ